MGKGYKHGGSGGGNPLNFTVKTYPSETELKADTPKENTIGVITTTTMTSWVFSATEPTEPGVGMVWISIGTSSAAEFNALKKNVLQVYPQSAKQYVGSKWEDKTYFTYQNGEWVSPKIYLFCGTDHGGKGDVSSLTGGWETIVAVDYETYPEPVVDSKKIYLTSEPFPNGTECCVGTKNKIDLTDYSVIRFTLTIDNSEDANSGFWVSPDDRYWDSDEKVAEVHDVPAGTTTVDINVSAVNGAYHINFGSWHGTEITVFSIELIK